MTKQEKIQKLLADKLIDANAVKVLESMTDEQFAVYQAIPPHIAAQTLPATEAISDANEDTEDTEETDEVDANKEVEEKPDFLAWARRKHATEVSASIEKILANKANAFTKEELAKMPIDVLERISSLATNVTDMTGAVGGSIEKKIEANAKKTVAPYVPAHMRQAQKK